MSLENLQALEGETKALDAEITAPAAGDAPADPAAPPPLDYNTEAAQAVDLFTSLVVGYAPKTADIWNDATKARVSAALAPVMEKYGFTFGNLPPELALIVMAGPPLYQSARIIADQMQADRAPKPEAVMPKVWPKPQGAAPDSNNPGVHSQVELYK